MQLGTSAMIPTPRPMSLIREWISSHEPVDAWRWASTKFSRSFLSNPRVERGGGAQERIVGQRH
jgi:hypothetical protein